MGIREESGWWTACLHAGLTPQQPSGRGHLMMWGPAARQLQVWRWALPPCGCLNPVSAFFLPLLAARSRPGSGLVCRTWNSSCGPHPPAPFKQRLPVFQALDAFRRIWVESTPPNPSHRPQLPRNPAAGTVLKKFWQPPNFSFFPFFGGEQSADSTTTGFSVLSVARRCLSPRAQSPSLT